MMAVGVFFYMIGFGMFGFVTVYWLFATAVVIITVGEMVIMPTASALATNFAPEDMRGRYMESQFALVCGRCHLRRIGHLFLRSPFVVGEM